MSVCYDDDDGLSMRLLDKLDVMKENMDFAFTRTFPLSIDSKGCAST
jgi:hypothetical protein